MASCNSLVRPSEVQRRIGYSKAWTYRLVSQGGFPKRVKIGSQTIAFVKPKIDGRVERCILESRDEVA